MTLLEARGVGVVLGGERVLRGVDLVLDAGEVVLLAGRNGAGKTTLLRLLAGLLPPASGVVHLQGQPLATLGRRASAQRIALVPQDTLTPFPYRVFELVLMGRAPHLGPLGFETRADHALAIKALDRLGIEALAERSIFELSGGERQLVAIARALAQQPRVLLLDEPAAHLDLAHRQRLGGLLRELSRAGCSVLLVSHDLGPLMALADRVALLAEGRLLATGPATRVLTRDTLRATFGVEAELLNTPAGPVVTPRAGPV